MTNRDNQYQRKARYNPNRETYVDENGNYVYLIWDEETRSYRREVCMVGDDGISPELRAMLDEMDAEEERRLDADDHHLDKVFDEKKKTHGADKSGRTPNPMDLLPQRRQRTFQDALREDPRIAQLLIAMDKLTPDQVDLVYAIYGEMKFGADVAREQGVSRQAINNRLKKIHTRLAKLMAEMDEA
jgi:DNA-directed RNA polymerase specialized sigma24 family protein